MVHAPTVMQRRSWLKGLGAAGLVAAFGRAQAQGSFPDKPIRWVLGFASGGGTDALVRGVAPSVGERLGTSIVIDNRAGANGNLAAETVAKSAADGYTLLYNTSSVITSPSLYSKLAFDPFRDFTPVMLVANIPLVLVAHPSVPATNLAEFIAYAKANPGRLSYASAGAGNSTHLANLLFLQAVGVSAVHVPYKGGGPALNDVMGGHVQFYMDTYNTALPMIRSGHVKAFAVTSLKRMPQTPQIPTVAETAVPGFEAGSWSGLMAPARTPREVIDKMASALKQSLNEPQVQERFSEKGAEARAEGPQPYAAFLKSEYERWGAIIRNNNVRLD
jgi:tripartite-type tricarboxylate transporter receptor subunit TctC